MEDKIDLWVAIALAVFGAGSEIIGLLKYKPNSWVQLLLNVTVGVLKRAKKGGGNLGGGDH